MDERLYGSLPHAPSEYLQQWWVSPICHQLAPRLIKIPLILCYNNIQHFSLVVNATNGNARVNNNNNYWKPALALPLVFASAIINMFICRSGLP